MNTPHDTRSEPDLRIDVAPGICLAGDSWGDPNAQPVVLLPGGGQTRHAWSGTGRALGDAGWYAMAFDQRGHGDSSWCKDGDYSPDRYADDVVDCRDSGDERLEFLQKPFGPAVLLERVRKVLDRESV